MMAMGAVLYGSIALLPLFFADAAGVSSMRSGLTTSPRGFGSIIGMIVMGRILGFVDGRWLICHWRFAAGVFHVAVWEPDAGDCAVTT